MHDAKSFAVAFGVGHAEVAINLGFGIASLLVPNYGNIVAVKARHAANNRGIIAVRAVSVDFAPIGEDALQIIQSVGALRMARQLSLLPCSLVRLNLFTQRFDLIMQPLQAGACLPVIAGSGFQDRDLLFDVFEFALRSGARFQVDESLGGFIFAGRAGVNR